MTSSFSSLTPFHKTFSCIQKSQTYMVDITCCTLTTETEHIHAAAAKTNVRVACFPEILKTCTPICSNIDEGHNYSISFSLHCAHHFCLKPLSYMVFDVLLDTSAFNAANSEKTKQHDFSPPEYFNLHLELYRHFIYYFMKCSSFLTSERLLSNILSLSITSTETCFLENSKSYYTASLMRPTFSQLKLFTTPFSVFLLHPRPHKLVHIFYPSFSSQYFFRSIVLAF